MKNLLIILFLGFLLSSCFMRKKGGSLERAQNFLNKHIIPSDTTSSDATLISKSKAVRIAKDSVYSNYGFWTVNFTERPYNKYFIDHYLYMSGTLRKKYVGGVFWVVVNRRNGYVEFVMHGK